MERQSRIFRAAGVHAGIRAFTLIEILVVIAIIAIIAAIVFPAFARVRDSARRVTCLSNLRQLGAAFLNYAQDYDELLPPITRGGIPGPGIARGEAMDGGWVFYSDMCGGAPDEIGAFDLRRGVLYSYTGNVSLYVCPSDARGRQSGLSYAISETIFDTAGDPPLAPGRPLAYFDRPAEWGAIGEETITQGNWSDNDSTDDGFLGWKTKGNRISFRHAGGSCWWFLDGHTKWYRPDTVLENNLLEGGK